MGLPSNPQLILTLHTRVLFVHPRAEGVPDAAELENATLRGVLDFILPTPRKLSRLTVSFVGEESMSFPSGASEQQRTLEKVLEVPGLADEVLDKGVHRFEFAFEVPAETSSYERSPHGRLFYFVRAKATFPGLLARPLRAEKSLFIVANPNMDGTLAYEYVHRDAVDGLGPLIASIKTPHLTIGGYLRFSLTLPAPPSDLVLHSIEFFLLQFTTLHSRVRPGVVEQCPISRLSLLRLYGTGTGAELKKDGDDALWEGEWVARIPGDDDARATTVPGSESAIRMSHKVEMAVVFSNADSDGKRKNKQLFTMTREMTIPSCCCMLDSIVLPRYSECDPARGGNGRKELTVEACTCGETLEELLGQDVAQGIQEGIRRGPRVETPEEPESEEELDEVERLKRLRDAKALQEYEVLPQCLSR